MSGKMLTARPTRISPRMMSQIAGAVADDRIEAPEVVAHPDDEVPVGGADWADGPGPISQR
jgi:hypothetical protein